MLLKRGVTCADSLPGTDMMSVPGNRTLPRAGGQNGRRQSLSYERRENEKLNFSARKSWQVALLAEFVLFFAEFVASGVAQQQAPRPSVLAD